MTLRPTPIETPEQVEVLRRIRNATSLGFAHHNEQITQDQQARWWAINRDRVRAWLYSQAVVGEITRFGIKESRRAAWRETVGFGLLKRDDQGREWTTVGVLPEHSGSNHGKAITSHLIRQAEGYVFGAARTDNPAAVRLHIPEEWMEVEGDDPRLTYFRTVRRFGPWPPEGAVEQWAEFGWALCR